MVRETHEQRQNIAAAPHIASGRRTRGVMGDVLIALIPALAVSTYFFGPRALTLALITIAASVAFELLYRLALRKTATVFDLSAVVTGLLLAMCLPVTAPYWVAVLGAGFSIIVVKQLFGGIGQNIFNPALAGLMFLTSFPTLLNVFIPPGGPSRWIDWLDTSGAVSVATPMELLRTGVIPTEVSLRQMLLGQHSGAMGEIAAFALILGGLYLVLRGVLSPRIPLCYLGTVAALTVLFPCGNDPVTWMLYQLTGGGLLLGAIFMATDYATAPVTPIGRMLYGVGCGGLTVFLRYFGPFPDGVCAAILCMNACVWFFDRAGRPRRFGKPWNISKLTRFIPQRKPPAASPADPEETEKGGQPHE